MKKYITYDDKEKSLSVYSTLIITADDANEIKLVVNNLVDKLEDERVDFNKMFRYMLINVPKFLDENETHNMEIEFSDEMSFRAPYKAFTLASNISSAVKIFKDGEWKHLPNGTLLNRSDIGKDIIFDLINVISKHKPTYVRYRFSNRGGFTGWTSFALGTNDFQKFDVDVPTAFTSLRNSFLEEFENMSKSNISKCHRTLDKFHSISEIAGFLTTFLKYDRIPNEDREYAIANNCQIVNDTTIDVTSCTRYSCDFSEDEIADGESKIFKMNGITSFGGTTYYSEYEFIIYKDVLVDSDIKVGAVTLGSTSNLNILQKSRFGEKTFDIVPTASSSGITLVKEGPDKYIVSANGYSSNSFCTIDANDEEFPLSILVNDISGIDVDTAISGSIISFTVRKIFYDESREEIQDYENLDITVLDNDCIKYRIDKTEKKIVLEDLKSNEVISILFKYSKNEKNFYSFKKAQCRYEHPVSISLDIDDKNAVSSLFSITKKLNNGSTEDIAISAAATTGNGADIDGNTIEKLPNYSHFDVVSHIKTKYSFDDIRLQDDDFISVRPKFVKDVIIAEEHDLTKLANRMSYNITASAIFNDGEARDITNEVSLSISQNEYDELNGTVLSTGESRSNRDIIVYAEYHDDVINDTYYGSKTFYATSFGLDSTKIIGLSSFYSGSGTDYVTSAYYNDTTSKTVSATYTMAGDLNGVTYNYDEETMIFNIFAKKSLFDRNITISSYYEEPGYEKFEHCLTMQDILIKGGYALTLEGTIIRENGSTSFVDENHILSAISHSSFFIPVSEYSTVSQTDVVTSSMIFEIYGGSHNFDFVSISNNAENYIIPYDCQAVDLPTLTKNTTYKFDFYDMLSSEWSYENNYSEKKETFIKDLQVNERTTFRIMDLIGNAYEYDHVTIKKNNAFMAMVDVLESYEFAPGLYTLEFIPISKLNYSYNAEEKFTLDVDLPNEYVVGLKNINLGNGIQILDVIPTFETSTGFRYKQFMYYMKNIDTWIPLDINRKAAKLVELKIAFAFKEG